MDISLLLWTYIGLWEACLGFERFTQSIFCYDLFISLVLLEECDSLAQKVAERLQVKPIDTYHAVEMWKSSCLCFSWLDYLQTARLWENTLNLLDLKIDCDLVCWTSKAVEIGPTAGRISNHLWCKYRLCRQKNLDQSLSHTFCRHLC